MVKVFGIKRADSGFGQYQLDCGGEEYSGVDSVLEYAEDAASENSSISSFLCDPSELDPKDEDQLRLAQAIADARGRVIGGHGTIVAFMIDGEIQLESVDVIHDDAE